GGDGSVMKLYSHDLVNGTTHLLTASGQTAKDDLFDLSIDSDGSELAFVSSGRNIEGTGESSAGYILRSAVSPNAVKVVVTKTDTTRATGNADSSIDPILVEPAISAQALSLDGRIVVFTSDASDIIPGDTNGTADIFVRNLQTKETRLINLAPAGGGIIPGSRFIGMSVDGARVAWFAPNPDLAFRGTIYIYDTLSGVSTPASVLPDGTVSNTSAIAADLSTDGRYLVFYDGSPPGPPYVAIRDSQLGQDTVVTNKGVVAVYRAFSGGGKYVLFYDPSDNPVSRILDWKKQAMNSFGGYPLGTSSDDSVMLFQHADKLYLYNPALNSSNLIATNVVLGALSADGSTVVYGEATSSRSGAVSRTIIYDTIRGTRTPLLLGTNEVRLAGQPSITPNARSVAFTARVESDSSSNNDFSNVYVYDRALSQLTLLTRKTNGQPANAAFSAPWISADGQTVLFDSFSPDLVANDSNVASDVFVAKVGQALQVQMQDQQNRLSISWKTVNGGKLQESISIDGPWTTIQNAPEPYVLNRANIDAQKIFRILY
ncbi:MAG TPA: hypothetical protein VGR78_08375, partial [Verrucomicrobiae bacterium]|nr:hypothetical protein [Verrucomicrobiae bacterium]